MDSLGKYCARQNGHQVDLRGEDEDCQYVPHNPNHPKQYGGVILYDAEPGDFGTEEAEPICGIDDGINDDGFVYSKAIQKFTAHLQFFKS